MLEFGTLATTIYHQASNLSSDTKTTMDIVSDVQVPTAGVKRAGSPIEKEGVVRKRNKKDEYDLRHGVHKMWVNPEQVSIL